LGARCVTVVDAGGLGDCGKGATGATVGSPNSGESSVSGGTEGVIPLGVKA
jgi:hypothetical protein